MEPDGEVCCSAFFLLFKIPMCKPNHEYLLLIRKIYNSFFSTTELFY